MILDSGGYQAKGGAIYPFTAYQGAETLKIYIYNMDLSNIPEN
jgi:hypothetical protein